MTAATSRQLLLLRHAKSDWNSGAAADFARPLSKRGRKAAPRIGKWLRDRGLRPDRVISSPAERARQTTLAVARVLGLEPARLHWEPRVYDASAGTLRAVIEECPATLRCVLLVGHNPGLEEVLEWLCGEATPARRDGKLLPTAALAVLTLGPSWQDLARGSASLDELVRVRELSQR